jgi:hypothetical protein
VVIRSSDGITWEPDPISSTFASPSTFHVVGGRLLALGAGGTSKCAHPFALDTWARGADGTWTEAPWMEAFCAGLGWGTLLDRDGTAALLGAGSGDQPLSWASKDGLHWRDAHPDLSDVYPRAAVVDGHAILVFGSGPDGRPVAVRSIDGTLFGAAPFPGLPAEATVIGALWHGAALDVFVGDGQALGVARRDGSGAWAITPAGGIRADQIGRISAVGDRLIAIGSDVNGRPLAWSSIDGLAWTAVAPPNAGPDTSVTAMAEIDGTLVLVGGADLPDGSATIGAVWVGSPELLGS